MVDRRRGRSERRSARCRRRDRPTERARRRRDLGGPAARDPGGVRVGSLTARLYDGRGELHASTTCPSATICAARRPTAPRRPPLPVALNVNENTHPVPEEVADDILDAVALALREVNRYPDREFTALREGFADYLGFGLTRDQIWAANGSNEVLQHVLQAFGGPGRTAFGFAPTYSMYPLLTRGTGASWIAGTRVARLHRRRRERGIPGRARRIPTSSSSALRTTPPARRCRSTSSRRSTTRRAASWSSTRRITSSRRTASRRR